MRVLSRKNRKQFLCAALYGAALGLAAIATPANAQLLPRNFFDNVPTPGGPARVEANTLAYDAKADVITASGNVVMGYGGYQLVCDQLRYNQGTGELLCAGSAAITGPDGNVAKSDRIEVTGGMKEAFIQSLTVTTKDGARITARDAHYSRELQNVLTEATYSPCGHCVDEKGRLVGWRVRADRLVQNSVTKEVTIEGGTLEIVGVPIAWVPWLSLPDPTKHDTTGFRLPTVDYDASRGLRVGLPYFISLDEENRILLTPQVMTRQGLLFAAEWEHKFTYGEVSLSGSGIYQLDSAAYSGTVGEREWRGAASTAGDFDLPGGLTAGWSYTAFTDAAYLGDYDLQVVKQDNILVNEVYGGLLDADTFVDLRLQQFKVLGDYSEAEQHKQASALPNAKADKYFNDDHLGQLHLSAHLLSVSRETNSIDSIAGVPYVFGYAGDKLHVTGEALWNKQYVTSGGLVATPLLGLRADVASYTGSAPVDATRGTLTPIAAIDVRYPMMSAESTLVHLFEPIGQLVYRGTETDAPGITNDDVHSFVLDDSNLFAINKFSGIDRQDTGLRANIGGRYLATLADGRWLEVTAGQSLAISGSEGIATDDEVHTGLASASYLVLGARGASADGLRLGAKLLYDTDLNKLARVGLGGDILLTADVAIGGDYIFLGAEPADGVLEDQHEVTVRAKAPLPIDYWHALGSLSWDVSRGEWLEARGDLVYDDGFFEAGAFAKATGNTHEEPNDFTVGISFKLKGPDGTQAF